MTQLTHAEQVSETLMKALCAASQGRLLGTVRGRLQGYTEGYTLFCKGSGQLVAHGATIAALLKRKAVAHDQEADVYRLTVVGIQALKSGRW